MELKYVVTASYFTPTHKVSYLSTFVPTRVFGNYVQPVDASTQCGSDEIDFQAIGTFDQAALDAQMFYSSEDALRKFLAESAGSGSS